MRRAKLVAPLTALASARVEVMSALVSFERAFEQRMRGSRRR